jgi:hypothetical protein
VALKAALQFLADRKAANAEHEHLHEQRRHFGCSLARVHRLFQKAAGGLQELNTVRLILLLVLLDRAVRLNIDPEAAQRVILDQGGDFFPGRVRHHLLELIGRDAGRQRRHRRRRPGAGEAAGGAGRLAAAWACCCLGHRLLVGVLLLFRQQPDAADLGNGLNLEMAGDHVHHQADNARGQIPARRAGDRRCAASQNCS